MGENPQIDKFDEWVKNPFDTPHEQILRHKFRDRSKDAFFTISTGNYEGGTTAINVYRDEESIIADKFQNADYFVIPHSKDEQSVAQNIIKEVINQCDKDVGWDETIETENINKYLNRQIEPLQEIAAQNKQVEQAKQAGYVQGVCECLAAVSGDKKACKKIMTEMKVTKEMAQKYANPETFEALAKTVFAPTKQEQKLERQQQRGRSR